MPPTDHDDAPIRRIADAVDGKWLKFVGKVVACEGEPLIAPITGRRCACFDAFVWSHVLEPAELALNDEIFGPTRVARLRTRLLRGTPFVIEDSTGRALVDPRGAYVRLAHDFKQGSPTADAGHVALADPSFFDVLSGGDRMEYGEGVLEIGEQVLVSGLVQQATGGPGGLYRVSADTRVRIVGSPDCPADITDLRAEVVAAGGDVPPPRAAEMSPQRIRQHVSGRRIIEPKKT